MDIRRPRSGVMEFRRSRSQAGLKVAFFVVFYAVWYVGLLATPQQSNGGLMFLLFYVAPLLALPDIIRNVKVLTSGELFTINSDRELIEKDDNHIARFDEVERIQIRVIDNDEGANEYRLSIVLTNQEKVRVEQSSDYDEICALADDLADIIGVEVTKKGKKQGWVLGKGD